MLGVGALLVAGCDVDTPHVTLPDRRENVATNADEALVREALGICDEARAQVDALAAGAGLRTRLAPLLAMHAAHGAALRVAAPAGPSGSPATGASGMPTDRAGVLARVAAVERDAHDRLVALAQRADSGRLARLLASMAAAISQRLTGLPRG
jgi:hypothetical protein